MSLRNKAMSGVIWTIIQNVVHRGMTLVVFVILARLLEPEDFGLVAIAGLLSVIGQEIAKMGFAAAIIQRKELEERHIDSVFWFVLLMSSGLYVLLVLIAPIMEKQFDAVGLASVVNWLGLGLIVMAISKIPESLMRRHMQFKYLAIRTMIGAAIGGVVGVVCAVLGFGVWSLVAKELVEIVVSSMIVWLSSDWKPRAVFSRRHLVQLMPFGLNEFGSSLLQILNQHLDRMVITMSMAPAVLGQYFIGKRLMLILQQTSNQTISSVMFPVLAQVQGSQERFRSVYLKTNGMIVLVAIPIFSALIMKGDVIVIWAFGGQWKEASEVAKIFGGVGLIQSFSMLAQPALKAKGYPEVAFKIGLSRVILDMVLFYYLRTLGIMGIAYAILLRSLIMAPIIIFIAKKIFAFSMGEYIGHMKALIAGLGVFVGVIMVLQVVIETPHNGIAIVMMQLVIAGLAYAATVYGLDGPLIREAISIKRRLPKS